MNNKFIFEELSLTSLCSGILPKLQVIFPIAGSVTDL